MKELVGIVLNEAKWFVADMVLAVSQSLARWSERLNKLHGRLTGWDKGL